MKTRSNSSTRRISPTLMAAAAALAMLTLNNGALAQSRVILIDSVRSLAIARGPYASVLENERVVIVDPMTRERLTSLDFEPDGRLALGGHIGRLENRGRDEVAAVEASVADFNLRFPLGRMELDRRSGDLTLRHVVDPRTSTPVEIAETVIRITDMIREERSKFRSAQRDNERYCTLTCRPVAQYDEEQTAR